MSTIYDRIRARRLELGLTAEDLAQQLGYKDKSSISKIENGKLRVDQGVIAVEGTPDEVFDSENARMQGFLGKFREK